MAPKYLKTFLLIFITSKFKINHVWDKLQRKLTQSKIETEKLAFKPEFVLRNRPQDMLQSALRRRKDLLQELRVRALSGQKQQAGPSYLHIHCWCRFSVFLSFSSGAGQDLVLCCFGI
uniref:Uncharacterized protein n=1 Tax=Corvus moneduloides TaxID=1196302 RepID=A0A8U7N5W3_CORMO